MSQPILPEKGWWRQLTITDFTERLAHWNKVLVDQWYILEFTHDLFVPKDGSGGHGGRLGAYFCGEATLIEEFTGGAILACFWTGKMAPDSVFYTFLPRAFIFFDKKTNQEDPLSIERRTRVG